VVREVGSERSEKAAMEGVARVFASQRRYEAAQKLARVGRGPLHKLGSVAPGLSGWTEMRDLPEVPKQTFREWWRSRGHGA
jgi:L-lactate dehydrogenase complex protein LldF